MRCYTCTSLPGTACTYLIMLIHLLSPASMCSFTTCLLRPCNPSVTFLLIIHLKSHAKSALHFLLATLCSFTSCHLHSHINGLLVLLQSLPPAFFVLLQSLPPAFLCSFTSSSFCFLPFALVRCSTSCHLPPSNFSFATCHLFILLFHLLPPSLPVTPCPTQGCTVPPALARRQWRWAPGLPVR